jgi:hypothetical protein
MNKTAIDWANANGQEQPWIFCPDSQNICHAYAFEER